jgi:hypothetical protein
MDRREPEPCRCPAPNPECRRGLGHPMVGNLWRVCAGVGCSAETSDAYRRLFDGLPAPAQVYARNVRCTHRSADSTGTRDCPACPRHPTGHVTLMTFGCGCTPRGDPVCTDRDCQGCPHHEPTDAYYLVPHDPPCGVVVGSYGYPRLVELQVRLIRHCCGNVPILISDDRSPGGGMEAVQALSGRYPDVTVTVSDTRIGHSGGDMAALHRGILWGAERGLRCVAKLSHRFLICRARWLQQIGRELLASGAPVAGNPCIEGSFIFPLRTEAIVVDVARWHRPDVLGYLRPRPVGIACEQLVWHACTTWLGGGLHRWPLFGQDRFRATPGVLWHVSTAAEEYHTLAARFGVELDPDFNVRGNHLRPDYLVG